MSVTVIVTCFNEEKYIEQAVLSVINQSRLDLVKKIFIVDDESSDKSPEIILDLAKIDDRIEVIQQENSGLAIARNNAIKKVDTEWICFLDGDDIWPIDKIEKQVNSASLNPDVALIYTDSYRFGGEERYIRARTLPDSKQDALIDYFLNDAPILSSLMIKTIVFKEVGLFDPDLRVAQDTEMWTRAVASYKTLHIKEALLFRRIHSASLGTNFERKSKYLYTVTTKISQQFPQLKKYKHIKDAKIRFEYSRRCIRSSNKISAIGYAISGLRLNPYSRHGYVVLMLAIVPFSENILKLASDIKMKLNMRTNQKIKLRIPHYERSATVNKLNGYLT